MNRAKTISVAMAALVVATAWANDDASEPAADAVSSSETSKPQPPIETDRVSHSVKPTLPYRLSYDVVGTPVVGSPVTINLEIRAVDQVSLTKLDFRSRDRSALVLGQSQPSTMDLEFADNESAIRQQVSVIPQREGRHYLNVRVSSVTPFGQDTTSMAIPIQVGEGGRELIEQGRLETTESGETVRVLTGN